MKIKEVIRGQWKEFCAAPPVRDKMTVLAVVIAGISVLFAYHALKRNTDSVLTSARSQIYTGDRYLYDREYASPTSRKISIYAHADASRLSPGKYISLRMTDLVSEQYVQNVDCTSASALYAYIWDRDLATDKGGLSDAVWTDLRRTAIHLEQYFYHMAAIYDYKTNGVIREGEWITWRGWFNEVGPHPVLLSILDSALEQKFITREFAREVQAVYCNGNSWNRALIKQFMGKRGVAFVAGKFDDLPTAD